MADGQSYEVVKPIAYREIGQKPNAANNGSWPMADGQSHEVVNPIAYREIGQQPKADNG